MIGWALTARATRSAVVTLTGRPATAAEAVATATPARCATSVRESPRMWRPYPSSGPNVMRLVTSK